MKKRLIMFILVALLALLLAALVLAACDIEEECDVYYVANPITSVSVSFNYLRWESDIF
ncbi:MAG: hypothetical protein FWE03_03880 [Firmicutes bacterium]|nr:hypothetical protein [Bacillota bacterium]